MSERKVVVTGTSGRIGRHLEDALARRGHDVVPLGHADLELDRDDAVGALAPHLGKNVVVVHLAARHPFDPASTTAAERRALIDTNVHGTMRVLEACRDRGAARVVFASTVEVVGGGELRGAADPGGATPAEVDETSHLRPLSDLAVTKLAGEDHLRVLHEEAGIPFVALRLGAVYGPGMRARSGITSHLADAAAGRPVVLERPADDPVDVVFLDDAVAALVLAVESSWCGIVAVTDGARHRAIDVARAALAAAGRADEDVVAWESAAGGEGPAPRAEAAARRPRFHTRIDRARRELGFAPQVSLGDGAAQAVAWLRRAAERAGGESA